MAVVEVTVNGRDYQLACDDGEEEHLANLAAYFDRRVAELTGSIGQVGETRLMLMAGLLVADDLSNAMDQLDEVKGASVENGAGPAEGRAGIERAYTDIDELATQVESLAARLETT
jgi:cell division protein ZapA